MQAAQKGVEPQKIIIILPCIFVRSHFHNLNEWQKHIDYQIPSKCHIKCLNIKV